MESIISSLQSIRKPSFLRPKASTNQSSQPNTEQKHAPNQPNRNPQIPTNIRSFSKQRNLSRKDYKIDLPTLSFTDFSEWDFMPYNELFIQERLRCRIEQNEKEYAKHGIIAQSIPLQLQIKSVKDILFCGGTLSALRMSKYSNQLLVTDLNKVISEINDPELAQILHKYNDLRRTTLISQPCLLCGIYDYYFLQFVVAISKRSKIAIIQSKLMAYLTKSLIYCIIQMNDGNSVSVNLTRDTTLDLLNYEAIHTLLMFVNHNCNVCYECIKEYKLFQNMDTTNNDKQWFTHLWNLLVTHGCDLNKVIKNDSLKFDTALMNVYNCEWIDLKQFLLISLMFQPFVISLELKSDFMSKWLECNDALLCEYNEMILKYQNCKNRNISDSNQRKRNEMNKLKTECNKFELEIQLTVFESFLHTIIDNTHLYQMIDYLYNNLKLNNIFAECDLLIMLLFCGHFHGYKYMFHLLLKHNNQCIANNKVLLSNDCLKIYKIFESFDVLLSVTNIISSNLKDIGKIIAIKACLFHFKFSKPYLHSIDHTLMEWKKFEFIQCLKVLFYDYGLYQKDIISNERSKYKKRLPKSIVSKESEDESKNSNVCMNDSENEIGYTDMISQGLKTQKKFVMECAYLDCEVLRCLMELKLFDESFIVDRFRNTFDFVQNEMGISAKMIWFNLQNKVFLYNKNVFLLRRMKEKELRFLFRKVVRGIVSKEYRKWINDFIMNGEQKVNLDKNMQIKKRSEIEDKYKLPNKAVLLIREYV